MSATSKSEKEKRKEKFHALFCFIHINYVKQVRKIITVLIKKIIVNKSKQEGKQASQWEALGLYLSGERYRKSAIETRRMRRYLHVKGSEPSKRVVPELD